MRPWLMRIARYAANGEDLPAKLTLGDVPQDKAVGQALTDLFNDCREENGRLKVRLDPALRDRALWLPLAESLGVKPRPPKPSESPDERFALTLRRLRLLHPDDAALIDAVRRAEPIARFFRTAATAPDDLIALFDALIALRGTSGGITLSELGAKHFNDSKALRNGTRRQQLEHLLRLQTGSPDDASATLFNACGIIENPYTTHAVVFAPFSYRTDDGAWLDWPHQLWRRGEAAILSWEAVRRIADIRLDEPCRELVTSENAAPFHRLVEIRRAALYTEGYPNAVVKILLRQFARLGVSAIHWGDTDLDGYRIAEQVARIIPARLYIPPVSDAALQKRLLPLTPEQRRRAERFVEDHPDFSYLPGLRETLAHGWLEQEQTIDSFA